VARRIVLALVVLAAACAALIFMLRKEEREATEERREERLLRFDDRAVTAMNLAAGGVEARFERTSSGWRMTAPVADAVDTESLEKVLQAAKRSPVLRVLEPTEALSDYGLDPPAGRLRVEAGTPIPVLDVGSEDPTSQGVFARVEGREGILLLGYPEAIVLRRLDPNRLRDPSLTGVGKAEVVAVRLERDGVALRLERTGGTWWITEPARIPASDARVEALLGGLDRMVPRVLDDAGYPPAPRLHLDPPWVRLTLETAASRRELRFGRVDEGPLLPALRDDRETLIGVERDAVDRLPLDLVSLTDTKLTKANRYRVVAWEDRTASGATAAEREGESSWRLDGAEVPEHVILGFLARLLEAPVESVVPGDRPGTASRTVRFRMEDGTEETLRIGPGRVATLDSVPGVVFHLASDVPEPPGP
jgi:hypothetical protein